MTSLTFCVGGPAGGGGAPGVADPAAISRSDSGHSYATSDHISLTGRVSLVGRLWLKLQHATEQPKCLS
jgi:hypothetical protein